MRIHAIQHRPLNISSLLYAKNRFTGAFILAAFQDSTHQTAVVLNIAASFIICIGAAKEWNTTRQTPSPVFLSIYSIVPPSPARQYRRDPRQFIR